MKGDFTRSTFKPEKHYSGVRMQQGRVQLDADWNEQADIVNHRMETGTVDVFGVSGAPKDHSGFEITNDLEITPGRFYVDGILCLNEEQVHLTKQEDFLGFELPKEEGYYLAYLDVWQRHLTALDDPSLKEEALRGADTTTRTKTVWQVKLTAPKAESANCATQYSDYDVLIKPRSSRLRARINSTPASALDALSAALDFGFSGAQNQLYRVEVHEGYKPGSSGTFKWSRDNGICVSAILEVTLQTSQPGENETLSETETSAPSQAENNTIVLAEPPRDEVFAFAPNQWVELSHEELELNGKPGILVRLISPVEGTILTFDPSTASDTIPRVSPEEAGKRKWKVRRWDHVSESASLRIVSGLPYELEKGIEVTFEDKLYKSGDYWLIPARSFSDKIEWPIDEKTNEPLALQPFGVKHHYARLAILHRDGASAWRITSDCRKEVTPLADQINLFYLGGDGQEGYPGERLPQPLQVGVTSGLHPIAYTLLRFAVTAGGGKLFEGRDEVRGDIETDINGVATCHWKLGNTEPNQTVTATLVDEEGTELHVPIQFSATLNLALSYRGGDGQEGYPDEILPQPLMVGVTRGLQAIANQKVKFEISEGGGKLFSDSVGQNEVQGPLLTDANGVAQCFWKMGQTAPHQTVNATLLNAEQQPLHVPIQFSATLNLALSYRGGDGQEGYPDEILPQPLMVGVTRGLQPVANQKVKFEISEGAGKLFSDSAGQNEVQGPLLTDANGLAKCFWKMGQTAQHQTVNATLLNAEQQPLHVPIQFKATLNLALSYRGGDGQEGYPDEILPQPLMVGVTRGLQPVANQKVKFEISEGAGKLFSDSAGQNEVQGPLLTDANGLAKCFWKMGQTAQHQTVNATLLNAEQQPLHVPIQFSATLNLALSYRGGDGQEGYPDEILPQPLMVGVTRGLQPVANQKVKFEISEGAGKLFSDSAGQNEVQGPLLTDANGLAKCFWKMGQTAPHQTVNATLLNAEQQPLHVPIQFKATLNLALSYRGGDGQEGYPDEILPQPLMVGVTRGLQPVANQKVKFEISEGAGKLFSDSAGQNEVQGPLLTDANGLAKCFWKMGQTAQHQTVNATLLNAEQQPLHVPIQFSATLNLALSYRGGDGQEGYPDEILPQPLMVGVTRGLQPVANQKVKFEISEGAGKLFSDSAGQNEVQGPLLTDANGLAKCFWKMGQTAQHQTVNATLLNAEQQPLHVPIQFSATLNLASLIQYDAEPECEPGATTIRSLFENGATKVTDWPDLDGDKHTTVKDILDGLLCHLNAARLPFLHLQDESGEAKFPDDVAQTVSAALNFLSKSLVPAGMIMAFANEAAPEGWLECNGDVAYEPTDYPDLFSAIGYKFGQVGNKFKVPDLRGEFVRGWISTRPIANVPGETNGRRVGEWQSDTLQTHTHQDKGHKHTDSGHVHSVKEEPHTHQAPTFDGGAGNYEVAPDRRTNYDYEFAAPTSEAVTGVTIESASAQIQQSNAILAGPVAFEDGGTPQLGKETRPRNVALMYCIKT